MNRVLLPLDGSPESECAIAAAMPLLRAVPSEITILRIIEEPSAWDDSLAYLRKAAGALRKQGFRVTMGLRTGSPKQEILAQAKQGTDWIAMSTRGRTGLARLLEGSVTEQVLRKADVPLILSRPGLAIRNWERLLVALDGSSRAEAILPDVIRLAQHTSATVEVLGVRIFTVAGAVGELPVFYEPDDPMPYLERACERIREAGVAAEAKVVSGDPVVQILQRAEEIQASLLCITTHGRSGISRLVMGSVAEDVLRRAPCPILIRRMAQVPVAAVR